MFRFVPMLALVAGIELNTYAEHQRFTLEPEDSANRRVERDALLSNSRLLLHQRPAQDAKEAISVADGMRVSFVENGLEMTPSASGGAPSVAVAPASPAVNIVPQQGAALSTAATPVTPVIAPAPADPPAVAEVKADRDKCVALMNHIPAEDLKKVAKELCQVAYNNKMATLSGDLALIATHDKEETKKQAETDEATLRTTLKNIKNFAAVGSLVAVFMLVGW